jgi:rhomboid protease GluP
MCRNCGSIVGAGEKNCAVCGASTAAPDTRRDSRPIPDRETLRFARAIMNRPYKFTIVLLVTNLFVFLLMWQSKGMPLSLLTAFPFNVLIAYGAKLNLYIDTYHQWWRFVTPMFLHVNLLHLLVNMYSLWIIGPYVEKLYGSAKFVVIWVLTGIAGVVASYLTVITPDTPMGTIGRFLFKIHDEPSAGASGALFGLVGVLFVFGIKFRHELPEGFKRAFGTGLLPMILLNLFIGYVGRGIIDNAAHLGGLAAGAALALVVDYNRPGERPGVAITWQVLRVAALAIVAVSFVQVARHFNDPLPAPLVTQNLTPSPTVNNFVVYVKTMNEAQEALYAAVHDDDPKGLEKAVKDLNEAPYLDQRAHELREGIRALVLEAETLHGASPPGKEETEKKKSKLTEEFVLWSKDYNQWLKTSGKAYSGLDEERK